MAARPQTDGTDGDRDGQAPRPVGRGAASQRAALVLTRIPKAALLLVIAAMLVAALILEGVVGGVLMLVLTGFFGWLLALAWPVLSPGGRLMRGAVVAVIGWLAVAMLLG